MPIASIGALVYGALYLLCVFAAACLAGDRLALGLALLSMATSFFSFLAQMTRSDDGRLQIISDAAAPFVIVSWVAAFSAAVVLVLKG